jgi:hypothetical protein
LNDANLNNGRIQVFVDQVLKLDLKDLYLANSSTKFTGFFVQSFFGGNSILFASPKNQNTFFKEFYLRPVEFK